MRIATIESKAEGKNLVEIAKKNPKLFEREIYIDGKDLLESQKSDSCISFYKPKRGRARIVSVFCEDSIGNFLCEEVVVADSFDDSAQTLSDLKVDVKAKFFTKLGDYSE